MKNVLILCTGNSCRSQIAEGYLKKFLSGKANVYSAGVEVHGLNSRAVKVMAEDGFDISGQTSNLVDEYNSINFDYIITVCDSAKERCPYFPSNAKRFHRNFPDPAKATGTEAEILKEFRRVRDLIKNYCDSFVYENF